MVKPAIQPLGKAVHSGNGIVCGEVVAEKGFEDVTASLGVPCILVQQLRKQKLHTQVLSPIPRIEKFTGWILEALAPR